MLRNSSKNEVSQFRWLARKGKSDVDGGGEGELDAEESHQWAMSDLNDRTSRPAANQPPIIGTDSVM